MGIENKYHSSRRLLVDSSCLLNSQALLFLFVCFVSKIRFRLDSIYVM